MKLESFGSPFLCLGKDEEIFFNVDQACVAEDGTQYPAGFFRNAAQNS